jgi:hypothetical protein
VAAKVWFEAQMGWHAPCNPVDVSVHIVATDEKPMKEPGSWATMLGAVKPPPGGRLIGCLTASATNDDGVRLSSLRQRQRPWLRSLTDRVEVGG